MPDVKREECVRKVALLEELRAAMNILIEIHHNEFTALADGDFQSAEELQDQLGAARAHKARLNKLYRDHVTSHGC